MLSRRSAQAGVGVALVVGLVVAGSGSVYADPPPDSVAVSAGSQYDPTGGSGSAYLALNGAGSSGGELEPGDEQSAIKAAAAAAGVPDATADGGGAGGGTSDGGVTAGGSSGGGGSGAVIPPASTECMWRAVDLPAGAPEWQGNDPATGQLLVNVCNGGQQFLFVPNEALGIQAAAPLPPPDPAVLAAQAYAELTPPAPTAHRSPDEDMPGQPWTVVQLWTWYWVDRTDWVPLSRTVELRGVSATVTATPVATTFDPGNGDSVVSCDGPGRPWTDPGDNSDPEPSSVGGCGYQYKRVTESVQATTSVRYAVTWTSSTGAGGALPDLLGSTTSPPFRVEQIQVVVGR